jgi:hypothetical protein
MFTRVDGMDFVNLRSPMLDDAGWMVPFIETVSADGGLSPTARRIRQAR